MAGENFLVPVLKPAGTFDPRRLTGFAALSAVPLGAFQNPALPPADARSVLPYKPGYDKRKRAQELLDAVGLGDRASALPSRLSDGQQQRVAIARTLMNSPRLLLADEPTGNLDSRTGAEIIDLLLGLRADRGMTVVIATHEPHVMARCDQLLRLSDGAIIGSHGIFGTGTPESTLARLTGLG